MTYFLDIFPSDGFNITTTVKYFQSDTVRITKTNFQTETSKIMQTTQYLQHKTIIKKLVRYFQYHTNNQELLTFNHILSTRLSQMGSTCGGQFGQNCQKLHENYKIDIFRAKQWGGSPQSTPLGETLST